MLTTVVQAKSMGKAAQRLNTTQPAVSRAIAELEHAIGVRLLDRSNQGVEPTAYGRALLHCAATVFDDLRQGIRNIEFLRDPSLGEISIGGNEVIIAGLLSTVFQRLRRQYPGITIHLKHAGSLEDQYRELRERKVDLVLGRLASTGEDDIETRVLYEDRIVVVTGLHNRWSSRRRIDLEELANEPWVFPHWTLLPGLIFGKFFARARFHYAAPRRGHPTYCCPF